MDLKQNPFSLYDFLGYMIPGAVFLYSALLVIGHLSPTDTALEFVATKLSFEKAEMYIPFVLLAYIVGHFLSFVSSITIERYSLWAHGYPSKYLLGISSKGYLAVEKNISLRRVMRVGVFVLLAPISILDWLLGAKAGMRDLYAKPLDNLLIAVLRRRIECLIDNHAQVADRESHGKAGQIDFFRYVYHYAIENAPNHVPKMQNYVALYGFLRTLTLISLVLFWIVVWHVSQSSISCLVAILSISSASVLAFLLFMGFVKFYRRFSLEALMAMAVTYKCKHNIPQQAIPEESMPGR
jgi:hypothetical protein